MRIRMWMSAKMRIEKQMKNTKRYRLPVAILHSSFFILHLFLACAGFAQSVELNGLASLAGEKWACFSRPNDPNRPGFILAEGESRDGIKLLSADLAAGRVQIDDHGQKFSLRICSSFALTFTAAPPKAGWLNQTRRDPSSVSMSPDADAAPLDIGEQFQIMAGNPGWGTIPPAPARTSANGTVAAPVAANAAGTSAPQAAPAAAPNAPSQNISTPAQTSGFAQSPENPNPPAATTPASADGSNPNSPVQISNPQPQATASVSIGANSSTAPDVTQAFWYQESMNIEQSRIETAAEVLAGNATPWPRTPLTPAGTNPQLVGAETFFGNQIPGFITPGFLNE